MTKDNYSLLEAVADIAFIAGTKNYYGGDSREDISKYIQWAEEFENLYKDETWEDVDYIDTITEFTINKLTL